MSKLAVDLGNLNPVFQGRSRIPQSQMFLIRESFRAYQTSNPEKVTYDSSQGDGGSSLPGVPAEILEAAYKILVDNGTGYGAPVGTEAYRRSVIEDYWQINTNYDITPHNVVACCGGRDALLKAYVATQDLSDTRGGFVLVSQVPWISYKWGPYSVGSNILCAKGDVKDNWVLTPEAISDAVEYAHLRGRQISCMIITSPDNPTGRYMTLEQQAELIKYAFSEGIPYALCDWIYHWVSERGPYDLNLFLNMFTKDERERIIVLDGLTKSLGGSNIRNAHLIASQEVCAYIRQQASHGVIPGFYGEAVAMAAYKGGFKKATQGIIEPINESRNIIKNFVDKHGIRVIIDQGYYAFLEVKDWIEKKNMKNSAELGVWLARQHGVAIIPGYYFHSCATDWIRFSYALQPDEALRNISRIYELWKAE